jgi:diacylglycerol kinase family enzyme
MLEPGRSLDQAVIEVHEKTHVTEATSALLLVLNGHASGIDQPDRLGLDLVARAQELGARARVRVTHSEPELWDALAEASEHGERVALVGGDGSLHAAANAPLANLPELALIPAGKANNIARALGIPVEHGAALRTAAATSMVSLDVLRVETPDTTLYAVEGVSAGFHADARSRYDAENSADFKQGLRALGAALRAFAPFRLRARFDGVDQDVPGAAQLFLSNLPYFAYGFEVDPGADPADGRFEAITFQARRRIRLLRLLMTAYRGGHIGRPGVRRTPARTVELIDPIPLVADAVPLGTTTATVTVEPARLRVAAPNRGGGAE